LEPELVANLGLVLGLDRYSDVMERFLAIVEDIAPATLFHGKHATVLCLMLLLLGLAELL